MVIEVLAATYDVHKSVQNAKDIVMQIIALRAMMANYIGSARDCASRCLPESKTCTSGTPCTSCKEGYYDTSNLCSSLCPGKCVTCSSNTVCESCKDGYYIGYQNDNINFPLLNDCTYKCRENGIRCSSYDSCLVCKTGHYGPNCEKTC
jgi:hypothetical protein